MYSFNALSISRSSTAQDTALLVNVIFLPERHRCIKLDFPYGHTFRVYLL